MPLLTLPLTSNPSGACIVAFNRDTLLVPLELDRMTLQISSSHTRTTPFRHYSLRYIYAAAWPSDASASLKTILTFLGDPKNRNAKK